jgi:hypothetical protein
MLHPAGRHICPLAARHLMLRYEPQDWHALRNAKTSLALLKNEAANLVDVYREPDSPIPPATLVSTDIAD